MEPIDIKIRDVGDGLVNGAIGTLRHIEYQATTDGKEEIVTLWFEFDESTTGARARNKCKPHVYSKSTVLSKTWVPVNRKLLNITLSKTVKCKRKQFPCVPACAITIHKSQGGTFAKIIYKYAPNQPQQLVYVAMSRATSLDGLYIITDQDKPLVFKHGREGNDCQNTRNIRNEYSRLNGHILPTVMNKAIKFCEESKEANQLLVTNSNVLSLSAHCKDIETDTVLPQSDYLVLTETWMRDTSEPLEIKDYECIARKNNNSDSDSNAAGGVAIYRNISSLSTANGLGFNLSNKFYMTKNTGDVCLAEITYFNKDVSLKFVLGAVYVHPNSTIANIGLMFHQALLPYVSSDDDVELYEIDSKMPILICGDFNINLQSNKAFTQFMKRKFNLDCLTNTNSGTTLGGTVID
nr:uncharacterized protein LOC112211183 [Halyomorpha halys]